MRQIEEAFYGLADTSNRQLCWKYVNFSV